MRSRPVRQGPIPDADAIVIPDKAMPVFQERVRRLAARLVETLTDLFPPPPGRSWQTKYNAKMFPDMVLLRAPNLAGQPVPTEFLENLNTLADWQGFARSVEARLRGDAEAVMETQTKSALWAALNVGNTVQR
jgi:hypothetical protein